MPPIPPNHPPATPAYNEDMCLQKHTQNVTPPPGRVGLAKGDSKCWGQGGWLPLPGRKMPHPSHPDPPSSSLRGPKYTGRCERGTYTENNPTSLEAEWLTQDMSELGNVTQRLF